MNWIRVSTAPQAFASATVPLCSALRLSLTGLAILSSWRLCLLTDEGGIATIKNDVLIDKAEPDRTGERQSRLSKKLRRGNRGFWSLLFRLTLVFTLTLVIVLLALTVSAQQKPDYDRLERASDLIRQQQLAAAEAELTALLRLAPREPNAHNLLGVIRAAAKSGRSRTTFPAGAAGSTAAARSLSQSRATVPGPAQERARPLGLHGGCKTGSEQR